MPERANTATSHRFKLVRSQKSCQGVPSLSAFQKFLWMCVVLLGSATSAMEPQASEENDAYRQLPKNVRQHVEEVRQSCKEIGVEPPYKLAGIQAMTINGIPAVSTDSGDLCGSPNAGINCTNRGCDFKIWEKQINGDWRETFSEHLYGKFVGINPDGSLRTLLVSISAQDDRCDLSEALKVTLISADSCEALVSYTASGWNWTFVGKPNPVPKGFTCSGVVRKAALSGLKIVSADGIVACFVDEDLTLKVTETCALDTSCTIEGHGEACSDGKCVHIKEISKIAR